MKFKRILISSLLIVSVTATTSCSSDFFAKKTNKPQSNETAKQMVYAPELDPDVHELITDQRFKSLESDEPLRFETAVTPEEAASDTPVELHDSNGNTLSKMYDDGTHSDRIAGDGIYTCSYKPKPQDETSYSYTAKIGSTVTEPASVRYFDEITDEDIKDTANVYKKFAKIFKEHTDGKTDLTAEKRSEILDSMGEYAKELYNNGSVVEYRVNKENDNMIIKLNSGISCVYANPTNGLWGGGDTDGDADTPDYAVNELSINGFIPLTDYEISLTGLDVKGSIESTISKIAEDTPDFNGSITRGDVYTGLDVATSSISNWGPNQIIFWVGHGGYDGAIHSYLCTNEKFDYTNFTQGDLIEDRVLVEFQFNQYANDFYTNGTLPLGDYDEDYDIDNDDAAELINQIDADHDGNTTEDEVLNWILDQCHPCLTSEYISVHCPDLTNSFVYLGSCHGLQDSVLAASLINKNCNVVVGYSDIVHCDYEAEIRENLITEMCTPKNTAAGTPLDYQSVQEAMDLITPYSRCGLDNMPKEESGYTYDTVTVITDLQKL